MSAPKNIAEEIVQKIRSQTISSNELFDLQSLLEKIYISELEVTVTKYPKITSPQFYNGEREELGTTFGKPYTVFSAEYELRNLKQGNNSAAEYASTFRRISTKIGWNEPALKFFFRSGLTEHLKDVIATLDMPEELDAYMQTIIRLDNRIREREAEKRSKSTPRSCQPKPRTFREFRDIAPTQAPAQLENECLQPMGIAARRKKYSPLCMSEKNRRRELNLCLYCGGKGHRANVCPRKVAFLGKATTQSQWRG